MTWSLVGGIPDESFAKLPYVRWWSDTAPFSVLRRDCLKNDMIQNWSNSNEHGFALTSSCCFELRVVCLPVKNVIENENTTQETFAVEQNMI